MGHTQRRRLAFSLLTCGLLVLPAPAALAWPATGEAVRVLREAPARQEAGDPDAGPESGRGDRHPRTAEPAPGRTGASGARTVASPASGAPRTLVPDAPPKGAGRTGSARPPQLPLPLPPAAGETASDPSDLTPPRGKNSGPPVPLLGPGLPSAGPGAGFSHRPASPARPARLGPQARPPGPGQADGLDWLGRSGHPGGLGRLDPPDQGWETGETWEEWLAWRPGESPRPRRTSVPDPDEGRSEDTRPPGGRQGPPGPPSKTPGPFGSTGTAESGADRDADSGADRDADRDVDSKERDRESDPERDRKRGTEGDRDREAERDREGGRERGERKNQSADKAGKRKDTDAGPPRRSPGPEASRRPAAPPPSVRFPRLRPRSSEQAIGRHNLYESDSARPGKADEEERVADQPSGQVLPVLPLGAGMTLVGLGLGFLALRMRRS
ncbi:hypothetical protein GCM10009863_24910 [Streptomyces axinellae]|uniref:Uncharacterized protein n=1 Tax=Streptomyces axinellae TaxID=552788 RepID=A0ABP6CAD2_9ACTN